jgi:endonuclease/exonuclease/phosphatase family metal-dependent hydrolase
MNKLKIVFWNVWGHRNVNGVHEFINLHRDADILCFTEVTDVDSVNLSKQKTVLCYGTRADEEAPQVNGRAQLEAVLCDTHTMMYHSASREKWTCQRSATVFHNVGFGSALLLRHGIGIIEQGGVIVKLGEAAARSRVLQWVVVEEHNKRYLVAHLHGIWIRENTKGDHELRTEQSMKVVSSLAEIARQYSVDETIFGGDLNLDIDTEAVRILESDGQLRNLIKEFGITSTRTSAYRNHGVTGQSTHADHVLVSARVRVARLDVATDITASDHAPLVLELELEIP